MKKIFLTILTILALLFCFRLFLLSEIESEAQETQKLITFIKSELDFDCHFMTAKCGKF